MISFVQKGDFKKTREFLKRSAKLNYSFLEQLGKEGVEALSKATPVDTGLTAKSWYYKIVTDGNTVALQWLNSNVNDGVPIAVIIQYGHATGTGGYIEGIDYINPTLRPIFERILKTAWKGVRGY